MLLMLAETRGLFLVRKGDKLVLEAQDEDHLTGFMAATLLDMLNLQLTIEVELPITMPEGIEESPLVILEEDPFVSTMGTLIAIKEITVTMVVASAE